MPGQIIFSIILKKNTVVYKFGPLKKIFEKNVKVSMAAEARKKREVLKGCDKNR